MFAPPRIVEFDLEKRAIRTVADEDVTRVPDRMWWVDVHSDDQGSIERIGRSLGLDDEDLRCLEDRAPKPGLSERDDSVTVTLESWPGAPGEGEPDLFTAHLTHSSCFTLSAAPIPCLDELRATYKREFRFAQSPGFVLFLVLDNFVESIARALGPLDDECEAIGERIYAEFHPSINEDILRLKRKLLALKRTLVHARDALMRLSGRRVPVITEAGRQSLGDVFAHSQALAASIDGLRDLAGSLLDSYMAVQAQRMNETVKVLTIFASVILPMTLIAGVYGMNFQHMPETAWRYGYWFALALMLTTGGVILFYLRRRNWT